ncbi:VanZ family protein [Aquibacillus rhizosphaerae]|uniref:VanZ family protein n=1 Tax=Aquibacillus rhizosphaerae TaxID=3051431 RepID=A0ABT7L0C1_9BACI|nr:VanZ family protein [Aquibacillus sp. LR5S19]MDL4839207.1 VanZ family protein [Aquibacillus sp. LR5S19]
MKKWMYWIFPIAWMGMIFYASAQPYQDQDIKPFLSNYIDLSFLAPYLDWITFVYHQSEVSVAALGVLGLIEFFIRKAAHVTVFLILCLAFYFAINKTSKLIRKYQVLFALVATIIYAIFDEIHQGFTPNRTPFIGDVFLDSFGACLGVALIFIFRRRLL